MNPSESVRLQDFGIRNNTSTNISMVMLTFAVSKRLQRCTIEAIYVTKMYAK